MLLSALSSATGSCLQARSFAFREPKEQLVLIQVAYHKGWSAPLEDGRLDAFFLDVFAKCINLIVIEANEQAAVTRPILRRRLGLIQDQWLCFTYVGGIVLLLAYRPQWTARLAVFGQAGRMALTNYMAQAAVLDLLSSGYGFGLTLRPLAYVAATALLFGVEAAASRAWLARFRFGPLEWLWRTITYAKPQPFYRVTESQTWESV